MDPAKLKVVDLRQELQQRGLDTKGNKAVLVKRLQDALDKEAGKDTADSSPEQMEEEDSPQEEPEPEEPPEKRKLEPKTPRREERKEVKTELQTPAAKKEEVMPAVEQKTPTKTPVKEEPKTPVKMPIKEELRTPLKIKDEDKSPEKSRVEEKQSGESKTPEKGSAENEESETNGESAEARPTSDNEAKEDEKMDTEASKSRGEKRKREEGDTPERPTKKKEKSPIKEDEPDIDPEKPQLSWYDSDLHLQVDKESFLAAKPFNDGWFGYIWAGARATHGVSSGKVYYEVKITEELKWEDLAKYTENKVRERDNRNSNRYKIDHRKDKDLKKDTEKKSETVTDAEQKTDAATEESAKEEKTDDNEKTEESAESDEKMETGENEGDKQPENNTEEEKTEEKKSEDDSKPEEVKKADETTEKKDEDAKQEPEAENQEQKPKPEPIPTHLFRVGFSILGSTLQLGEAKNSFGYESSGKFITDKQFQEYGVKFGVGDVVGAFLNIDEEEVSITFSVNGEVQPTAITISRSELPEENFALFPHFLSRNYAFEVNFGNKEEPWFPLPSEFEDYKTLLQAEEKVAGPKRAETRGECEVLLMVGLPASGKTHWVLKHIEENKGKKDYTLIGTHYIFDRMTVDGESFRSRFSGPWKIVVDKIQKCLNKLTDTAALRKRNFIIDQTNVFPSAQRRKLRAFEGYQRKAICMVCAEEEQTRRQTLQKESDHGKVIPESTMLDLKAQMELPQICEWLDEMIFPELQESEAKEVVKKWNEEARAKGYQKRFNINRRGNKRPYQNVRDRRFVGGRGGGSGGRYDRYSQGSWGGGGWGGRRGPQNSVSPRQREGGAGGWQQNRAPRPQQGGYAQRDVRRNQGGYGGGRSQGGRNQDGWHSSGGGNWGSGNSHSHGGWNQQMFGSHGYGAWSQQGQGQGWKYSGQSGYGSGQGGYGSGQSGYGSHGYGGGQQGGYGSQNQGQSGGYGQSGWNYYGQYGNQQGWGGQGQASGGSGQHANYSQQDWAQYARQYAQQQQARK